MALSNLPREPRREITETLIGLLVIVPVAVIIHLIAGLFPHKDPYIDVFFSHFFALFIVGFGLFFLWLGVIAIHNLGENVCNALAKKGLELRPRRRHE